MQVARSFPTGSAWRWLFGGIFVLLLCLLAVLVPIWLGGALFGSLPMLS